MRYGNRVYILSYVLCFVAFDALSGCKVEMWRNYFQNTINYFQNTINYFQNTMNYFQNTINYFQNTMHTIFNIHLKKICCSTRLSTKVY